METYKSVEFSAYEISNLGNVKKKGKPYTPKLTKTGTHFINLSTKPHYISRLVYELFVGKLSPSDYVIHLDGDTTNNRVDNLYKSETRRAYPVRSLFTCIEYPDLKTACEAERYPYSTELYRMRNCPHRSMFERV